MRLIYRLLLITSLIVAGLVVTALTNVPTYALQLATETLQPTATFGGPTIFVAEQVNVRSGPGTFYEQVGVLIAGQTAPAVGRSTASEWIQIDYPGGPGGKAWGKLGEGDPAVLAALTAELSLEDLAAASRIMHPSRFNYLTQVLPAGEAQRLAKARSQDEAAREAPVKRSFAVGRGI